MTRSIREQILREVLARCQTSVAPATVLRQPTGGIPRERTPVLICKVQADAPIRRSNDRMERELTIQLIGHARDPTDGFAVADDLLCRAHRSLFADVTLGGLALGITELETDYEVEDADADAVAIPATYRITYRTRVSDISEGG